MKNKNRAESGWVPLDSYLSEGLFHRIYATVAVLVLLTTSAGAGVVASHFLLHADRLGDLFLLRVAVRLCQQVLTLLADLRLVDALRP